MFYLNILPYFSNYFRKISLIFTILHLIADTSDRDFSFAVSGHSWHFWKYFGRRRHVLMNGRHTMRVEERFPGR